MIAKTINKMTFGRFVTLQRGFDLPKQDREPGTFPVVASTSVQDYHSEYKVKPPGVVTGRSGSLGSVQYLRVPFWPLNTTLWVKDFKGNDPKFVFYFLSTLGLERYNSGVGVPTLNRNHLDNLDVFIPIFPTQRKIASILSAYDDLIENNQRRIKILEEMAQNFYREWFVKFRFPGHENVRFVDSPLGRIPEGWEVGRLADISNIIPGYAFKSKDWQKEGIPVIKIKNIQPDNTIDAINCDRIDENIFTSRLEKYELKNGDLLIAMTGATAGKVGRLRTNKKLLLNQRVAKFDPNEGFESFLLCFTSTKEQQQNFYNLADGAAQPNMSGRQIENYAIVIPPLEITNEFNHLVYNKIKLSDNLFLKNQNLRRTRDFLLPKLISGELDVSELDITIPKENDE